VCDRQRASAQIDAPAEEAGRIGRMTRKLRAAEVALDPAAVRERPGRVSREEAPHVEVLDAVLAVDIVLRRTLAEGDAEQPLAVAPPNPPTQSAPVLKSLTTMRVNVRHGELASMRRRIGQSTVIHARNPVRPGTVA
jgi:hypothetical protein